MWQANHAILYVRKITLHSYIVSPGESISSVSLKFGVSPKALARANGLKEDTALYEGMRLEVPVLMIVRRLRPGETVRSLERSLQLPPGSLRRSCSGDFYTALTPMRRSGLRKL